MNRWNSIAIAGLLIMGMAGCKKNPMDALSEDSKAKPNEHTNILDRGADMKDQDGGASPVHAAAGPIVKAEDLEQLEKSIKAMMARDGKTPSAKAIKEEAEKNNKPQAALIREGAIVLTNCTNHENGIIAYSAYPREDGDPRAVGRHRGKHYFLTVKSVSMANPDELKNMLKEQGNTFTTPPKK